MSIFGWKQDPPFLVLDRHGLPVAGDGIDAACLLPIIETLHDALERGETDYAVWGAGADRYVAIALEEGIAIVKCGPEAPLTKVLFSREGIRERCARLQTKN
ncbi:MAG TPA: hypothetical protein PKH10_00355 [bacterium]|nr:hypothetical protein [bacterium]